MSRLRLGFLGVGAMGRSHVKLFHQNFGERAEAIAACTKNSDNIRQVKELAPEIEIVESEDEIISSSDIDAVVVSTPNFNHVELAERIVAAGKHLFLEKACGVTMGQCDRLKEIDAATDRVILIGHELRYSPFFGKVHELIQAGEIGEVRMVWCKEFRGPFQPKSGQWIQDDRMSGGCLVDKNCHHFDLMNWWVGSRPQRVAAFGSNAVHRVIEGGHQVHDHATVSFDYANGAKGTLQVCMFARDFPEEYLEMGVIGDKGTIETDIPNVQIILRKVGGGAGEPIIHKVEAPSGEGWGGHLGFTEIHEAFLDAVEQGTIPLTSVPDCLDGTRIAIAGETSIREGKIEII